MTEFVTTYADVEYGNFKINKKRVNKKYTLHL